MLQLTVQILIAFSLVQAQPGDLAAPQTAGKNALRDSKEVKPIEVDSTEAKPKVSPSKTERANYLGIRPITIPAATVSQLKDLIPENGGLMIASVSAGSPAADAGIKRFDLLTKFNDNVVKSSQHLRELMAATKPNQTVTLTILRAAKEQVLKVKLKPKAVDARGTPAKAFKARAPKARRNPVLAPGMLKTGPAAGPKPSTSTKQVCSVEVVQLETDLFKVTTMLRLENKPKAKDSLTGSLNQIADHYNKSNPVVRNNVAECFKQLKPNRISKPAVKVVPRTEGKLSFVRFISIRPDKDGNQTAYIYDKQLKPNAAAGPLIADDSNIQRELKNHPDPVRKHIDQTIRRIKDFANAAGPKPTTSKTP